MLPPRRFAVVGQVARDLVVRIDGEVDAADAARVVERRELLGGKGANQAVGLTQLGGRVALVGAVGDDDAGRAAIAQASADGIDVCAVSTRGETALLIDLVGHGGRRRLLEHVPAEGLVSVGDVSAASGMLRRAHVVCLQLQQPADALLGAARLGRESGALVALDGGARGESRDALLALADIVRADPVEAGELVGFEVASVGDARRAAAALLGSGPRVAAVAVPGVGDLVAWRDGDRLFPFGTAEVVDTTGAGDAFFAGLVAGVAAGWHPENAGRLAAEAAAATVGRLGGRPDLTSLRPD